jgi:menaquinone-dependent protoporphyrinogen oxidase
MKVLVSAASKHGATTEIAAEIAAALTALGVEATVIPPADVSSVEGYDACVVGSAVYAGRWLDAAKELLHSHKAALRTMPVWLFSSGPIGAPPKPVEESVDARPMAELVAARGHRTFAGEVDRSRLGLGEKAVMAAVRAPEGDFRPWGQIEAWAREIATALHEHPEPSPA